MSAVDIAEKRAEPSEGFRSMKYLDTRGNESIGIGFNIAAGISLRAARALFREQLAERADALAGFWWAKGLDDARMSVVIEIAFNDGVSALLHYPKMLAAIGAKNWQAAHDECLDSDAARELPPRYKTLAQILLTGVAQ
jgi:GH24 family phage-related lysozyme (muramidase)